MSVMSFFSTIEKNNYDKAYSYILKNMLLE